MAPPGERTVSRATRFDTAVDLLEQPAESFAGERIEIEVANFTDGRVFSLVRQLRQRIGFRGEIHVIGDLLPDQIDHLARCGVDEVRLTNGLDPGDRPGLIRDSYLESWTDRSR